MTDNEWNILDNECSVLCTAYRMVGYDVIRSTNPAYTASVHFSLPLPIPKTKLIPFIRFILSRPSRPSIPSIYPFHPSQNGHFYDNPSKTAYNTSNLSERYKIPSAKSLICSRAS